MYFTQTTTQSHNQPAHKKVAEEKNNSNSFLFGCVRDDSTKDWVRLRVIMMDFDQRYKINGHIKYF